MGLLLLLIFVVAPLVELYVIIQVAQVIGGWETVALLILESIIGAWLLKRQGLATLGKIGRAVDQGRVPGKEMVDGLLLLVAGAFMLAPGFVSDVLAYLLIIPITRVPFRVMVMRRFKAGRMGGFTSFASADGRTRFVGTFRAGGAHDTTGREAGRPPRTELGP